MQRASSAVYAKSGASGSNFVVLPKVGRAEKVTTFVIELDQVRLQAKKFRKMNASYRYDIS